VFLYEIIKIALIAVLHDKIEMVATLDHFIEFGDMVAIDITEHFHNLEFVLEKLG